MLERIRNLFQRDNEKQKTWAMKNSKNKKQPVDLNESLLSSDVSDVSEDIDVDSEVNDSDSYSESSVSSGGSNDDSMSDGSRNERRAWYEYNRRIQRKKKQKKDESDEKQQQEFGNKFLPITENVAQHYDEFFSQTTGSLFTWTLENLAWAWVVYSSLEYIGQLVPEFSELEGGGQFVLTSYYKEQHMENAERTLRLEPLLYQWCVWCNAFVFLFVAFFIFFIAFNDAQPGVYSPLYMQATMAYCGFIGALSSVYSAVTFKSRAGSLHWQTAFFGGASGFQMDGIGVIGLVVLNIQWLISLCLTFVSTPYGKGNFAFLHIPVAFFFSLMFVLINETATRGVLVCSDDTRDALTIMYVNASIVLSFIFHVLSAVEWDPADIFPANFHSTLSTRAEIDPYAFLHGSGVIVFTCMYAQTAQLSSTTFVFIWVIIVFGIFVTAIHSFDFKRVVNLIFRAHDDQMREICDIRKALAVSYLEAQEAYNEIRQARETSSQRFNSQVFNSQVFNGHSKQRVKHNVVVGDDGGFHNFHNKDENKHTEKDGPYDHKRDQSHLTRLANFGKTGTAVKALRGISVQLDQEDTFQHGISNLRRRKRHIGGNIDNVSEVQTHARRFDGSIRQSNGHGVHINEMKKRKHKHKSHHKVAKVLDNLLRLRGETEHVVSKEDNCGKPKSLASLMRVQANDVPIGLPVHETLERISGKVVDNVEFVGSNHYNLASSFLPTGHDVAENSQHTTISSTPITRRYSMDSVSDNQLQLHAGLISAHIENVNKRRHVTQSAVNMFPNLQVSLRRNRY